jgi:hypothetical protein
MNYLAPLCVPTYEGIKPFADPQSYELLDEKAGTPAPVFRNTLKKMQGRWSGQMEGIDGTAAIVSNNKVPPDLTGLLANNTGYDLENVEIMVHAASGNIGQGTSYMFAVGSWAKGATIDLSKAAKAEMVASVPVKLEDVLQAMGRRDANSIAGRFTNELQLTESQKAWAADRSPDLLNLLWDAAKLESLTTQGRAEGVPGLTRTMDCTKAFYAAGGLIVAHAGNLEKKQYVKSPVPITVNGRLVGGKGDVLFAWALPLEGKANAGGMLEQAEPEKLPARNREPQPRR